jgi:hypothetical protein
MGKNWEKEEGIYDYSKWRQENRDPKAYLYFLEQIIACHAGHTVICNDKIHFHFLQKHKKTERKKSET